MNLNSEMSWIFCGFLCTFVNFSGDVTELQIGVKRVFLNCGSMVNFNYQVRLLARSNDFNKITIFDFGVGKLSEDFLGAKFAIFDSQLPYDGAKPSSSRASRRFASKQISPRVPAGNFEIWQVSYKFNLLKSRGPRRMFCTLQCPESKQIVDGELKNSLESPKSTPPTGCMVLRNKTPRWHEHLQCWFLNFHGRVTVASAKKTFSWLQQLIPIRQEGKAMRKRCCFSLGRLTMICSQWITGDPCQPSRHLQYALPALVQNLLVSNIMLYVGNGDCLYSAAVLLWTTEYKLLVYVKYVTVFH